MSSIVTNVDAEASKTSAEEFNKKKRVSNLVWGAGLLAIALTIAITFFVTRL